MSDRVHGQTPLELPEPGLDELSPVDALAKAVARFCAVPTEGRHIDQLGEDLIELRRVIDQLELCFAQRAARFTTDEAAWNEFNRYQVYLTPTQFIRHDCQMTGHAVANAVAVGEQAPELQASVASMASGKIGFTKLAMLASAAQDLRTSPTSRGFDEERLLQKAERGTVNEFRRDCAHARHAADEAEFLRAQAFDAEARTLELKPCGDGSLVYMRGYLDAVGGATVRSALEPLARLNGTDDHRDRPRRLADALVELCNHCLDAGAVPQRASQRAHIQVTTTLETLLGLPGAPAGDMEFAPPIAAATVARVACDSSVVRILLGSDSAIVDVGRLKRVVPAATRRALDARDRGCVWPGCDRTSSWTQAHHVIWWTKGGRTDLGNLALLCYRHHWMVHEGRWQLVRSEDGTVLTIPPVSEPGWPEARAPDGVAV